MLKKHNEIYKNTIQFKEIEYDTILRSKKEVYDKKLKCHKIKLKVYVI